MSVGMAPQPDMSQARALTLEFGPADGAAQNNFLQQLPAVLLRRLLFAAGSNHPPRGLPTCLKEESNNSQERSRYFSVE